MSKVKAEKGSSETAEKKDAVAKVVDLFDSLITAFIPALLCVTFILRPYIIPTGSMADTLKGAHFRLRCAQCGYKYQFGASENSAPNARVDSYWSRCPSCGNYQLIGGKAAVTNGDKILAIKCIYQFFEPKRWDVVVFKNPIEPTQNFIKRMIGLPEETVEIIDGDIYIDGRISRKPPKIQNELWMPVYDNDYQPAQPGHPTFNNHTWQQPFKNIADSKWKLDPNNRTEFSLHSEPNQINSLVYDTTAGNDFKATYAYNDSRRYGGRPYCSDLKVRFYTWLAEPRGIIGIALSKYETVYKAWLNPAGEMVIARDSIGRKNEELARRKINLQSAGKPVLVEFANVDHQLIFQVGEEKLTFDLEELPERAGAIKPEISPQVKIFGSGKLTLSHITIFRDIHYTSRQPGNNGKMGRATQGAPLTLGKDEFFVLGDNSPASHDSRWWSREGIGNNGLLYRKGIVPREYLIGKAFVVFWPGGFKPFAKFPLSIIPDVGQIRFIHGGSTKNDKI